MRRTHELDDVTSEWDLLRHPLRMPNIDPRGDILKIFYTLLDGYQGEPSTVHKSCARCIHKKNQYRQLQRKYKRLKRTYNSKVCECLDLTTRTRQMQVETDSLKANRRFIFTPPNLAIRCTLA